MRIHATSCYIKFSEIGQCVTVLLMIQQIFPLVFSGRAAMRQEFSEIQRLRNLDIDQYRRSRRSLGFQIK